MTPEQALSTLVNDFFWYNSKEYDGGKDAGLEWSFIEDTTITMENPELNEYLMNNFYKPRN